ncbi:hypothetical protein C9374_005734 [Naegleria lovaniensis]|uniref:Protein kinase domain-containing protein n=1 Tax=Naegleria lovaniensis TaxID=51637 RepID=A0AA88GP73_NAELO|nr:uncharacterized protein C9374_005734 [Naegleria lovaniensis]KAG2381942.1 hypothetical protein C9374_005734 [Naegleria lovaniensis]
MKSAHLRAGQKFTATLIIQESLNLTTNASCSEPYSCVQDHRISIVKTKSSKSMKDSNLRFMMIEIVKQIEFSLFEISIQEDHEENMEHSNQSIYILKFSRDVEREFKCFKHMYSYYRYEYIPQYFIIENNASLSKWKAIATRKSYSPLNFDSITLSQQLNARVMAKRVFEIVKAMHDCHLIHNDIKPDNFIIDSQDGKLKIIDFDMSYISVDESMSPSIFCGDKLYRSPNKMTHSTTNDETWMQNQIQSDLYSCGLVMALFVLGPQIQDSLKQTRDKHHVLHQQVSKLLCQKDNPQRNNDKQPISTDCSDDLFHTITSLLQAE